MDETTAPNKRNLLHNSQKISEIIPLLSIVSVKSEAGAFVFNAN